MTKETLFNSFSGGRTSGYMSKWLLDNKSDEYNIINVFANTGLEAEGTLEFADKCDKEWGLNLVWLEAKVNPIKNSKIQFNIVDFKSASRNGEPYYEVCKKHGVPNSGRPFCTQYLKTYVINAYKVSLSFKRRHLTAIGIRADEFDRMSDKQLAKGEVLYPLISMKHTTKHDVAMFFRDNSFDLEIDPNYGNCVTCFKKSDRHLMTIAKHSPRYFDFMEKVEKEFGHIDAGEDDPFRFFRENKTVQDIKLMSQSDFKEFDSSMYELQLSFDIDPIDRTEGNCGARCEIGSDD
tara:strand:+ start:8283 stop:9158 length:876 start_codon:yes stop_codon:yes gene_type:complete